MSSASDPSPSPKYTYTPFPQSKIVHPLRPYYVPPNTDYYYTPGSNAIANNQSEQNKLVDEETHSALKELGSFALVKYVSTAISNPFEVSKTLLQVQYLPNEDVVPVVRENNLESDDESSDENLSDFDQEGRSTKPQLDPTSPAFRKRKTSDKQGYLLNTSIYDESTRPAYMLPPLDDGVWGTISILTKHKTEGWKSLWKGQFTGWLYDMAHLFFQPTIEGILNDAFDLYDDTIPLVYLDKVGPNLATLVASHIVVGVLLSPLEVARTRLIVQTSSPSQRKYKGLFDCLRQMIKEEGLSSLYWGHNLLPSIVYHAIDPLLENSIPILIDRIFHISASDSPLIYGTVQLLLNTVQLMITLPIETIRKRLHCQVRSRVPGKRFETVVQTRQAPYVGMLDCGYRIIVEEGISQRKMPKRGNAPKRHLQRKQTSWLDNYGIRGLYNGFSMHFTANLLMFVVQAVNGGDDDFEDI
ncbi:7504_t:CDS:2 [Paraglomus occultum]|uniref:7504_t:CDS:1 n=1 Tax=Paraglomus occultum TaxID=144539 RepID=A0A9N8ZSQ9_9GLOM|nr:7504_t:CDS:2 [Paraglomus occultum]